MNDFVFSCLLCSTWFLPCTLSLFSPPSLSLCLSRTLSLVVVRFVLLHISFSFCVSMYCVNIAQAFELVGNALSRSKKCIKQRPSREHFFEISVICNRFVSWALRSCACSVEQNNNNNHHHHHHHYCLYVTISVLCARAINEKKQCLHLSQRDASMFVPSETDVRRRRRRMVESHSIVVLVVFSSLPSECLAPTIVNFPRSSMCDVLLEINRFSCRSQFIVRV